MSEQERRPAPGPRTVEDRVTSMLGSNTPPKPAGAGPLVPLSTRVPEGLRKRLRIAALHADRGVQDVVAEAIEEWLTRHGG